MIDDITRWPMVAIDVETTGLDWTKDKMFGVAIACWAPDRPIESAYFDVRESAHVLNALRRDLPRCKKIVNHNIKFDAHFLLNEGIDLRDLPIECTSVRAAIIDEHEMSYSLDSLCTKHIGQGKDESIYSDLALLFGGKPTRDVQIKNLSRAPTSLAARYARLDPELALRLWLWQEAQIKEQELQQIVQLENDLLPVLVDIERHGVRVDLNRTHRSMDEMDVLIKDRQLKLMKAAGTELNVNSSPQMRSVFGVRRADDGAWYTSCGLKLNSTEGGQASVDQDTLRTLASRGNEIARHALEVRKAIKARSFLSNHILAHARGDRVYPNYNQTKGENELGTKTGRFSINDPALQQIPARDEEIAAVVRSCFVPEDGEDWVCSDWDQFEFRWFAHYVKEPSILKMYAEDPNTDFHKMVAQLTGLPRSPRFAGDANAKQINLGLVFGMGQGKMALEMGLEHTVERHADGREFLRPGAQAIEVFDQYHSAIPGVRSLLDRASAIARSRGYVKTIMGRHLRFPNGKFTHKAGGLVFQGTSADCMKVKMVEMHKVCKAENMRMLLSVHDELDFSVPRKGGERKRGLIKRHLETFDGVGCPVECRVPIRASVNGGPNWWEACK